MTVGDASGRWKGERTKVVAPADRRAFGREDCVVLVVYRLERAEDPIAGAPAFVVGTVPGVTEPPRLADAAPSGVLHEDWDAASSRLRHASEQPGLPWDVKAALQKAAKWIEAQRSGLYLGVLEPTWLAGDGTAREETG